MNFISIILRQQILVSILFMTIAFNLVNAQVPRTLSYQGQLCGADGTPVDDGDYNIAFALYPSVNGGTGLWEEVQLIATNSGIFSAVLGSVNPIHISFNSPMWLGIKINNSEELSPRTALSSSAYSLGIAGDVSKDGLMFPNGFGSDPDYVGSEGNHLSFGHEGVSEDFIGYKANAFYVKDSPGGGDNTEPDLVVGGKIKSESGGIEFPDGTTQTTAASGSSGFPAPNFDSGWITIVPDEYLSLVHNLGGNFNNYFVDLQFETSSSRITNRSVGGNWDVYYDEYNNLHVVKKGAYIYSLDDFEVVVHLLEHDNVIQRVQVRIWVYN